MRCSGNIRTVTSRRVPFYSSNMWYLGPSHRGNWTVLDVVIRIKMSEGLYYHSYFRSLSMYTEIGQSDTRHVTGIATNRGKDSLLLLARDGFRVSHYFSTLTTRLRRRIKAGAQGVFQASGAIESPRSVKSYLKDSCNLLGTMSTSHFISKLTHMCHKLSIEDT